MGIWQWLTDHLMPWTESARLHAARRELEEGIMSAPETVAWLSRTHWNVNGQDGPAALRQDSTRDAAIFNTIQAFYDTKDDTNAMMRRFEGNGFNNGTTTHTYLFNAGEGTLGRSSSNHQAVMIVDESTDPPIITLNFRGTHIFGDIMTHINALGDFLSGRPVKSYEDELESFWQGAKGDITRIMDEVAARHPGTAPRIIMAGHSYGSDAAARMIPRLAEQYPQWRQNLELLGFGATPSFTASERDAIYEILGRDPNRARQYMAKNDWINPFWSPNCVVGEVRQINCSTGHYYGESSNAEALIDNAEARMARDPAHAEQYARDLVAAFRRDPDSVLSRLASYTAAPPSSAPTPPRLDNAALQPA